MPGPRVTPPASWTRRRHGSEEEWDTSPLHRLACLLQGFWDSPRYLSGLPTKAQPFFPLLLPQTHQRQETAFPASGPRTISANAALPTPVWAQVNSSWVGSAPHLRHRKGRGSGEVSPTPKILAYPALALTQGETKATSRKHQQPPEV